MTKYQRKMTAAERFFWLHAGFSYDSQTETKAQGKRRCAIEMAEAEAYAQDAGWTFEWQDDWSIGDHSRAFDCYKQGEGPETCETCLLTDEDNRVLASLGCIDDATPEYRRVIEAELADEAYTTIKREQRNDAAVYDYCAL